MGRENRAAIYVRVSTQMQVEEGYSMEAQQDILMDVIKRKELQFFRAYSDPGISKMLEEPLFKIFSVR